MRLSKPAMQLSKPVSSPFATGLSALYGIAFLSGISIGLFNPLISALMAEHQVSDLWIGANSTVYFLVMALGTPLVPKLLRWVGLRRSMMLGLMLMGMVAPLFPQTSNLGHWFAIRIVMGMAACIYFVAGQTGLNYLCPPERRSLINGINDLCFCLGFGLGPTIGAAMYKVSPSHAFLLGSGLILSGIVVAAIGLPNQRIAFHSSPALSLFKKLWLPLQGSFAYGVTVATLVSLYPVFMLRQNYSLDQIGYLLSIFVVGSLLATLPVTHVADRWGRLKVLRFCAIVGVGSLLALAFAPNPWAIAICSFFAGASISPIFPLSLSLVGECLPAAELSSGVAFFTAIYSAGCTAGPLMAAWGMHWVGDRWIFGFAMIVFVVLIGSTLQKRSIPTCPNLSSSKT